MGTFWERKIVGWDALFHSPEWEGTILDTSNQVPPPAGMQTVLPGHEITDNKYFFACLVKIQLYIAIEQMNENDIPINHNIKLFET